MIQKAFRRVGKENDFDAGHWTVVNNMVKRQGLESVSGEPLLFDRVYKNPPKQGSRMRLEPRSDCDSSQKIPASEDLNLDKKGYFVSLRKALRMLYFPRSSCFRRSRVCSPAVRASAASSLSTCCTSKRHQRVGIRSIWNRAFCQLRICL